MRFFGTDGIRDLAGEGRLTPDAVWRIGRALGRFAADTADGASPRRIAIGRDPRPSGPELVGTLASALAGCGAEVADLGVVPTPVVAWSVVEEGLDLGIAVSASHNAAPYNGVKPLLRGGRKLTVEEERRIEAWIETESGAPSDSVPPRPVEAARAYVAATAPWLAIEGDLSGVELVVDLAAGAASATAPAVLEALGARVQMLHTAGSRKINDGCGTESPETWLAAVRARAADVAGATDVAVVAGIAFDGDADRVLLADATGRILDGDDALAILAADWKRRGRLPGDRVVGTVMANLGVEERLGAFGVALDRVPVGDRNIAERMRADGLAIGAEPSGHVVLERDGALVGDGLVAGVRLLQAARRSGRSLEALRRETPRYPQILRNVRMVERRPLEAWPALTDAILDLERSFEGRGRIVVRYSGTEPLLRIMVEGKDAAQVDAAVATLEAIATAATSA